MKKPTDKLKIASNMSSVGPAGDLHFEVVKVGKGRGSYKYLKITPDSVGPISWGVFGHRLAELGKLIAAAMSADRGGRK